MSAWKATSPCAMPAIACHDVLAIIFDYLAPGRHALDDTDGTTDLRQIRRQALASSAVTCRILSHHALDVLWRELDDVYPLLKILPSYKSIDLQVTFSGAILPEHWIRFELYADRVRGIGHPPRKGVIHPSVWMLLATKCRTSPQLPRLRKLVAPELRVSEISALFLLVSPTLRAIDISLERDDLEEDQQIAPHVATSLLQTLPLLAPDLEDIKLGASLGPSDFVLGHGYFQSLKDFKRLRTLWLPSETGLDELMLQTLSTITSLEDLACNIGLSGASTLALPPNAFHQLKALDITGSFPHLVTFIIACQFTNLARLVLQISGPASSRAGGPAASFAAISRSCNPSTLTSSSASLLVDLSLEPGGDRLIEHAEAFLAFPNITAFHFSSFFTEPSVRDDDLGRFGMAWPRLATFHAERRWIFSGIRSAACPTLTGVIDLARRCPDLEELRLPKVDVQTFPERSSLAPSHGSKLRSLAFQDVVLPLTLKQYSDVASVLDRTFPAISLKDALPVSSRVRDGWKEILRQVEAMRRGRDVRGGPHTEAGTPN